MAYSVQAPGTHGPGYAICLIAPLLHKKLYLIRVPTPASRRKLRHFYILTNFVLSFFHHQTDDNIYTANTVNKHPPKSEWSSLPMGLSLGWSRTALGPKSQILLPRSSLSRPIEYTCQVSSTSAQLCQSLRVLKMIRPDGSTDT